MKRHLFFFLLSVFVLLQAQAAAVVIRGKAPEYAGQVISSFAFDDLLSEKRYLLQSAPIKENGDFELHITIAETQKIILAIHRVEGVLYVEPGHDYAIGFPPVQSGDLRRFDCTEVQLQVHYLPDNDLNLLIRSFDAEMSHFFDENYFYIAAAQNKGSEAYKVQQRKSSASSDIIPSDNLKTAQDSMAKSTSSQQLNELANSFLTQIDRRFDRFFFNRYFEEYVRFSKAQIQWLAGTSRAEIYRTYFADQDIPFYNPAWFRFFNSFYVNIFTSPSAEKQKQIDNAIQTNQDIVALAALFQSDTLYQSPDIRYMAWIKGLREIYHNPRFSSAAVAATLQSFARQPIHPTIQKMADNVRTNLIRAHKGWALEDFTLLDIENEKWTFSAHKGKYIYFIFFANWCSSCIKEMQILEKNYATYRREIDFVAISMDDSYGDFKKYLQQYSTQKFTFLFGGNDLFLREKFNLRALPHAVLISPEGTFLNDYTRKPSEGAAIDFEKIKKQVEKKSSSGTWKN